MLGENPDISISQNISRILQTPKNLPKLTCHESTDGKYRYSTTVSLTLALDRGGCLKPLSSPFTPGNEPLPIVQRLGGSQSRSGLVQRIWAPPASDPSTESP